jgi:NADH:ubiquinone reductase (H+-translocating)
LKQGYTSFNRVAGQEYVFVPGDVAAMVTKSDPQGPPMLAQPAMQQGELVGKKIANIIAGQPLLPFTYKDQGAMATIGRNQAVADLKLFNKAYKTQGFLAWLIWIFIHLISIVGFRNKFGVLANWVWNYSTFYSDNRLIPGNKQESIQVADTIMPKTVSC